MMDLVNEKHEHREYPSCKEALQDVICMNQRSQLSRIHFTCNSSHSSLLLTQTGSLHFAVVA